MHVLLVLVLLALTPVAAHAAAFTLSETQKKEAMRVGASSISEETFDAEWRVSSGGPEGVTVLTPFHRLAVAARYAACKNETL